MSKMVVKDIAYQVRQYDQLHKQGLTHTEIVAKLSTPQPELCASAQLFGECVRSHSVIEGKVNNKALEGSLFAFVCRLNAKGPNQTKLFPAFNSSLENIAECITVSYNNLYARLSYFGYLTVLFIVVSGIYSTKVVPTYLDVFDEFVGELPSFTMLMLSIAEGPWVAGVFIILGFSVIPILSLLYINRFVLHLKPAPHWLSRLPVVSRVLADYHDLLALTALRVYCAMKDTPRLKEGIDIVNEGLSVKQLEQVNSRLSKLQYCEELGTLNAELDYELRSQVEVFLASNEKAQMAAGLFLQSVLFVLIGVLVLAMYLPIFIMGEMV